MLNNILRKAVASLDLVQWDRNYYDQKGAQVEPRFGLEVWPGYKTSIRQHEYEILFNCEAEFKMIRYV